MAYKVARRSLCSIALGLPCRNRPAEFARYTRCPPVACQRRWLPFPVSVMLIFKCFLVQVGDFYFFTALANKPPLKGEGDQRSWWRGSAEIFYSCFRFHGRNPSVSLWLPAQHKTRPTGALSGEPYLSNLIIWHNLNQHIFENSFPCFFVKELTFFEKYGIL